MHGYSPILLNYEIEFGKPRDNTVLVNCANVPSHPAKKLLRRLDEFRRGLGKFGWNPTQDDADLRAFTGEMGYVQQYSVQYLDRPRPSLG